MGREMTLIEKAVKIGYPVLGDCCDAVLNDPQKIVRCYEMAERFVPRADSRISASGNPDLMEDFAEVCRYRLPHHMPVLREAAERAKAGDTEYLLRERVEIQTSMAFMIGLALALENDPLMAAGEA
jgi:hypothetical protein